MTGSPIQVTPVHFQHVGRKYRGIKLIALRNGSTNPDECLEGPNDYIQGYESLRLTMKAGFPGMEETHTYVADIPPSGVITRSFLGEAAANCVTYFIYHHRPKITIPGQGPKRVSLKDVVWRALERLNGKLSGGN
ncbi:hypothetical protein AX16_002208 [Volvariella volvacea WC 439]|nr:hypothetical protein AX16_002208 [Volvariella volvacea WC 439]